MTMDHTAVINAVAAIASTIAAFASVFVAVRLGRRAKLLADTERQRQDRQAEMEAMRANEFEEAEERRSSFNAVAEWRRDLREWASEAIDVLTEATYLRDDIDGKAEEVESVAFACRHRLSALIDRGRLYLPNIRADEYGQNKPYAYRGYRHSGLDPLVAAERVLSTGDLGRFIDRKHALVAMKREFVSSVQRILDPAQYNQDLLRKISRGNTAVTSDRHPLTDSDTLPLGAAELLENPPSYHIGLREAGVEGAIKPEAEQQDRVPPPAR
jgi:hypothetical protein